MTDLLPPIKPEPKKEYVRLTRLGRNLRPGDEICVIEDLPPNYRTGRVEVTSVTRFPAWRRGIFCGPTEYRIRHSGPVAGKLTRHLWVGDHWGEMRCDAKTKYDIYRPV